MGFDHGVGHPLLLLYDAKAPNCQKRKEFKRLGHYPSNTVLSLFCTMIKLQYLYNYLIFLPFLQYLCQLRTAESRLRGMNTAQAGNLVENLG